MPQSSAYIVVKEQGTALHFTGVTEITHRLGLKIFDKADVTEAASFVNGAKNEPDRVTLTVIETDAEHSPGWAARMLADGRLTSYLGFVYRERTAWLEQHLAENG